MLLLRFANDLEEYGKVEMMPVLEGKRMIIMISPLKVAPPKKEKEPKEGKAPKAAEAKEDIKSEENPAPGE